MWRRQRAHAAPGARRDGGLQNRARCCGSQEPTTVNVRVIILNGVGSVGKSSTARALQAIAAQPFLRVQMDAFFEMLPEAMIGHPDGVTFETVEEAGRPSVIIRSGPVMDRAMHGMRHAIAAMAAQG